jgi:hypothetical protein
MGDGFFVHGRKRFRDSARSVRLSATDFRPETAAVSRQQSAARQSLTGAVVAFRCIHCIRCMDCIHCIRCMDFNCIAKGVCCNDAIQFRPSAIGFRHRPEETPPTQEGRQRLGGRVDLVIGEQ